MKESAAFICGLCLGIALIGIISFDWPLPSQVGYSYEELKELKEKCEAPLPRDMECEPHFNYAPEEK